MKGKGSLGFGGFGAGTVGADIVLADGSKWTFFGVIVGVEVGVAAALPVSGDFPGVDHMSGPCTVAIAGAAVGPGKFQVSWSDTKGEIGKVNGDGWGANISFAGGVGGWTKS